MCGSEIDIQRMDQIRFKKELFILDKLELGY